MTVLALDFDGTIADDDGNLSKRAIEDLETIAQKDVDIIICTGRRLSYVEPKVRSFYDAIVAENGGVIDWKTQVEVGNPIPEDIVEICREYVDEEYMDVRRTAVFIDRHPDVFDNEFRERVKPYVFLRNNDSFHVKDRGQSKAHGARHAMAYRHHKHKVIGAGDSENDIDLLKFADEALMPSNADPEMTPGVIGKPCFRGSKEYWEGIREELFDTLD